MTRNFVIYISFLIGLMFIHYFKIYDMKFISVIIAVVIGMFLIGGNHTAMRTYSSLDVENANYDANHINDEPSLETILKVCIPLIIYIALVFIF